MDMMPNQLQQPILPQKWKIEEEVSDHLQFSDVSLFRCGMTASGQGKMISASAAGLSQDMSNVHARCSYELMERISILQALANEEGFFSIYDLSASKIGELKTHDCFHQSPHPDLWQYAKSNGVAAGRSFQDSALRAAAELVERDRILRSWYSNSAPKNLSQSAPAELTFLSEHFDFRVVKFTDDFEFFQVVAVFGFPRNGERPMIFGFGCSASLDAALSKASSEFLQRLCFLWEEVLPEITPDFSPSPHFHQEHYLYPLNQVEIKNWLNGESNIVPVPTIGLKDFHFVDLTPVDQRGKLCVLKAIHPRLIHLTFGRWNPVFEDALGTTFSSERWLHFIP